ncbi:ABC transporter permease [Hoyosella sp. YIM 151337]|nr:ABC transporter permease [Hoyosella sp. YIM 151337]MCW4352440.1 ABC transporter permease [Hoyosella sp. YIM 151337]
MSVQTTPAAAPQRPKDERLAQRSFMHRVILRPELGSVVGALLIFGFFIVMAPPFRNIDSFATVLYASSTIGIMAIAVALLMIGGEFDLSAGVNVTTGALAASMIAYNLHLNLWLGAFLALFVCLGIGFVNGYLVTKTKIHSFLITLGMFLMLQGANIAVTKLISNAVSTPRVSDMEGWASARAVFSSSLNVFGVNIRITVLWWLLFAAVATFVLFKTKFGNWIFSVGGNADSARAVGVPVARVKIILFMTVGFAAWFSGMHILFAFDTVQSGQGVTNELIYIAAAVIGGCLLTGGYGTAIGACVGAFIFGMTNQGIVLAGWEPDWFKFFLGAMLLLAVIGNNELRKYAANK